MSTIRPRRWAAAAVLAVAVPLLPASLAPAGAAEIGKMSLTPSSGQANDTVTVQTFVTCPAGTSFWETGITGAGIPMGQGLINGNTPHSDTVPERSGNGYTILLARKFSDVSQEFDVKMPNGVYTVYVQCYDDSFLPNGEINAGVQFTPSATNYNPTFSQLPTGTVTTTALAAGPVDPVAQGTPSTLTATVTPSNAVGSVRFKQGGTNLGALVPVSSGQAVYTGALPAGNGDLTAVFVPTDVNVFTGSTSATVPYVVVGAPTISGTVRVGSTVSCATSPGGTQTFAWLADGVAVPGFTTKSVKIPSTWYTRQLSCKVTVERDGHSLDRTSAAKVVAIGAPLKNLTKPVASGTATVGHTLTCKTGTWSPTATSYAFKWLRDGSVISGKTASTYPLVSADRNHKVACKVYARKPGYTTGVATSAARLIG